MAKQTINIGSTANDGTGDPLRTAFTKTNENFTEVYNSLEVLSSGVKSTASGDRRIEEVVGNKTVSVTELVYGNTESTTATFGSSSFNFYVDATANLNYLYNNSNTYTFLEFSIDDEITWIHANLIGFSGSFYEIKYEDGLSRTVQQGATIYYRVVTGADPMVWWNKNELPGGSSNFRGAIIDYHAYTGEATIIGTIHIVDDDGEENITHTEVSSGSSDSENDDLWFVQDEGTISYRRIDGESKTLKIHWSAKVFYGSEYYD